MKFHKGLLVILLIFALAISGCSSLVGNKWAARVNGEEISVKEVEERLDALVDVYKKMGLTFKSEEEKQALEDFRAGLLEVMIDSRIIAQEVQRLGLNLDDETVQAEYEELKKNFTDDEQYLDWLKSRGLTEEELKQNIALYAYVTKDTEVTDEEVRQFFKDNLDLYGGQLEQVKARHILVETEEDAKQIIEELKAGKDFAELAKEKSIEPAAKESGGDLGYFTRNDMIPEFSEAAFSQPVGEISETPVKTLYGYHVILVEDHKPAIEPDFDQVKDKVKQDALQWAKQQKIQAYYIDLRNKAEVEYNPEYQNAE